MITYAIACTISLLALLLFFATGGVAVYVVYHGVWKYLPYHVGMMAVQLAIILFLNAKFGV